MPTPKPDRGPTRKPPPEPSHRELTAKLKLFFAHLRADTLPLVDPKKFQRDLDLLRLDTTYEVMELLDAMAHEIAAEHYCAPHKRKTSYEVGGAPMYDFVWDSAHRGERMYVKFAVAEGQPYLISCHPDKRETDS